MAWSIKAIGIHFIIGCSASFARLIWYICGHHVNSEAILSQIINHPGTMRYA